MEQFVANGLCAAAIYSLMAVGFGMIFAALRTFHVAHGAVFTAASFATYGTLIPLGWPLPAAVLAGLLAGTALGVFTEVAVYYPLVDPRREKQATASVTMISSLGFYVVAANLIAMVAGNDTKVLRSGAEFTWHFAGVVLTVVQVAQLATAAVTLVGLVIAFRYTHVGRIVRALADDPELVDILGHNVRSVRITIMAVGSLLASGASILSALDTGTSAYLGFNAVLFAAVATIVGGLSHPIAPALGALVLGILQSLVAWRFSNNWVPGAVFAILIVALLVRPGGLVRTVKRLEEQ